jgi:hypothetical protein
MYFLAFGMPNLRSGDGIESKTPSLMSCVSTCMTCHQTFPLFLEELGHTNLFSWIASGETGTFPMV